MQESGLHRWAWHHSYYGLQKTNGFLASDWLQHMTEMGCAWLGEPVPSCSISEMDIWEDSWKAEVKLMCWLAICSPYHQERKSWVHISTYTCTLLTDMVLWRGGIKRGISTPLFSTEKGNCHPTFLYLRRLSLYLLSRVRLWLSGQSICGSFPWTVMR